MKQVILEIPDNKYKFIMELLKSFRYLKVQDTDISIPEKHKNIVRQRIKASETDPSRILNWDEVKNQFDL
ncbi:MAG: addiction module protein [Prolixibacteraceae bacterium]